MHLCMCDDVTLEACVCFVCLSVADHAEGLGECIERGVALHVLIVRLLVTVIRFITAVIRFMIAVI